MKNRDESEKQVVNKKRGPGKGRTNNPHGRPKLGLTAAEHFRAFLSETDPRRRKARIDALMHRAYNGAMSEARDAATWGKLILDRAYGTPVASIELSGKGGAPIPITYVRDFEGV
jgi:hypothetical protein